MYTLEHHLMRILKIFSYITFPVILLTGSIASADIVTFEFSGKVFDVPTVLAPIIFSNDTFRGVFAYDTNTVKNNFFDDPPNVGRYWDPYTQVALRIGSFELSVPNAEQVSDLGIISVGNDWDTGSPGHTPDSLSFQVGNITVQGQQHALFGNATLVNGYHLQSLLLGFGNDNGSALNSANLPSFFEPNKFSSWFVGFYFNSGDGQFDMGTPLPTIWGTASISNVTTELTPVSQVPLPGAVWLMGSGLLFLLKQYRRVT